MDSSLPTPKGKAMMAAYSAMAVLTTVTMVLRAYVRLRMVKPAWEDLAAGIGWLVFMVYSATGVVGPFHGTGQHVELILPGDIPISLGAFFIGELTYVFANLAVKLSIALMLLRYCVEDYQKKLVYIVTGTTQIYSVIFLFIFAFQCMPTSFFWERYTGATKGHCINPTITVVTGYIYLAGTIIFDWTMAILPWFIVRKMHLDNRTKRGVAVVLALGSIASIATLIRIPYVATLANTHDFLYDNVDLATWADVETGLALTASSIATLRPLFRRNSRQGGMVRQLTPKLNTIHTTADGSQSSTAGTTLAGDSMMERKSYDVEVCELPRGTEHV